MDRQADVGDKLGILMDYSPIGVDDETTGAVWGVNATLAEIVKKIFVIFELFYSLSS